YQFLRRMPEKSLVVTNVEIQLIHRDKIIEGKTRGVDVTKLDSTQAFGVRCLGTAFGGRDLSRRGPRHSRPRRQAAAKRKRCQGTALQRLECSTRDQGGLRDEITRDLSSFIP